MERRGPSRTLLPRSTPRFTGFTLMEAVVAIAIALILATSLFPTIAAQIEQKRVNDAAKTFRELADAIWAFRAAVTVNPGTLEDLTTAITASGVNSCGVNYSTPNVNAWSGPYYKRQIIRSTGLPMSSDNFGHAQNALVRSPAGVSTPGTTSVVVTGVQLEAATELNTLVDGEKSNHNTVGRVRWTLPADASGFVNLSYHVAINGC